MTYKLVCKVSYDKEALERFVNNIIKKHQMSDFEAGWDYRIYKAPTRNFKINNNDFKTFKGYIVDNLSIIPIYKANSFFKKVRSVKNHMTMGGIIIVLNNQRGFNFKEEFRKNLLDSKFQTEVLGNGVKNGEFWRRMVVSALKRMIRYNNFPRNSLKWKEIKGRVGESNPEMKDTLQHYYSIIIIED